ncbi:MAG: hypothetical protein MUF14_02865 [Hyphomonadaceae bacterium]|jgi:hypothetical protein|nr:hypothetical protein [Hyphomonadaceae bacterium]
MVMKRADAPAPKHLLRKPLLPPGSLAWLSLHYTRLTMRRRAGDLTPARIGVMLGLAIVLVGVMLAASWQVARLLGNPATSLRTELVTGGSMGAFIALLLFSSGLVNTAQSIGERSDLDLLLSAPQRPERTAAARLLGATAAASIFPLIIACCTLLLPAILVSPTYALSLVSVVGVALACAGLGQVVVVPLHAMLGASRARLAAQVLAISVTAGPIIWFNAQAAGQEGASMRTALQASVGSWIDVWPLMGWFAEAMLGRPAQAVSLFLGGALVFAVITRLLGQTFAMHAATAGPVVRKGSSTKPVRFGASDLLGAAMRKEWRSIVRDPWLITQLGMQGFALVPIIIVIQGMGGLAAVQPVVMMAVVTMMVLFSGQIAASLSWVTASTEQAQDLLDAAPVARSTMVLAKALTAIACAMIVIVGLSAWTLWGSGLWAAQVVLVTASLNAVCVVLIELWRPKPSRRDRMMRAGDRSILSIGYAMLSGIGWGLTGSCLFMQAWFAALVPAVFAAGLTAIAWWTSPARRAER